MSIAVVGFSMVVGILRPQSSNDKTRLFTLRDVSCVLLGLTQAGFMFLLSAFDIGRTKVDN